MNKSQSESPGLTRVMSVVLSVCLASGIALLANAQTSNEAAVRTQVAAFFEAYQKKDLDGLMLLWSERTPDLASARQTLKEKFAASEQVELKRSDVHGVSLVGDRAVVTAVVELRSTASPADNSNQVRRTVRFIFVKDMASWKVWSYLWSEVELASALAAARTDEEQERLLGKASVTVELVKELLQQGLYELTNNAQALRVFALSQKLAEKVNDRKSIADAFLYTGHVHRRQRHYVEALANYHNSLKVFEELGDKVAVASTLTMIGLVYDDQSSYLPALDFYQRSLRLQQELRNRQAIGYLQRRIGRIYSDQGDYPQALRYHQESLKLSEETGDRASISSALSYLGSDHFNQGDYVESLRCLQKSLKISEELDDKANIAITLNGIGLSYFYLGDYERAFEYYSRSFTLGKRPSPLANIGTIYAIQGDYQKALEYHQRSLTLIEESGDKGSIAGTLDNIGLIYALQSDYKMAFEYYQKSLKLSEAMGNKPVVANTLSNLGLMYADQGNAEQALKYYQRSLELSQESNDKRRLAATLACIAQAHSLRKDFSQALTYAERASAIATEIGVLDTYSEARTTAGKANRMLNRPDQARQSLDDAITTIEQLRNRVAGNEQDQQRFFENKISPYFDMVDLLISQNDRAAALAYAERAKARVLLDVLQSGRTNITKAMTPAEQQREQELAAGIVSLNSQILIESQAAQPNSAQLSDLNARLQSARLEHEAFQTSLFASHPELRVQRGKAQPITLEQAGALLPDDKTALLEFMVGPDNTYLFIVSRGRRTNGKEPAPELSVYTIPVQAAELSKRVESFLKLLAEGNLGFQRPARDLYDLLLKPAEKHLQGKSILCIVPDGVLWEMPFQALQSGTGAYLLQDYALFYAPSLSVLGEMGKLSRKREWPSSQPSLLGFGNPALSRQTVQRVAAIHRDESLAPLPNAEKEVRSLAQLYPRATTTILVGPEAREDRAKSEAGKYRVLHFATHAMLDDNSPLYSRVLLSQVDNEAHEDGLLEAREIMELDLKADLAILSACQTGRGRIGAGEGVIGMTWAFFVAGCPTTVVSQWKVDSASTTELMIEFHRQLTAPGNGAQISKAQALRMAAMSLLKKKKYSHPFYWAGFIVVGNGM